MNQNEKVQKSLLLQYLIIAIVVASYWLVSILTVFINKALLSHIDLDAPIFIAFYQTLTTVAICFVKKAAAAYAPEYAAFPETDIWRLAVLKKVFPMSLMFAAMILFNTLCLRYVTVAFYYIGRSLTTLFNVILTYLILNEKTSLRSLLCCCMILFGFYLGVDQESLAGSLSVAGTIFGVLASLSLSLFSILTKNALPHVNYDIWALSYYNNIFASIIFVPFLVFKGEITELMLFRDYSPTFWLVMTIGGVFGFAIGFLTSLQIKYTSALTHNISGTAKACAQTILATYWYKESKTWLWWCSNAIILLGSAGYARVKQLDMEKRYKMQQIHNAKV